MARDYTGRIVKDVKVMSLGAKVALLTIGILFLLAAITAPLVVLMSKESRGTISSGDFIYQYNIESGNVYYDIKKYIGQNTENVVIPSEYNGAPVVGVLKGAFNGNSSNVVKNIKRISFDTTNYGGVSRIDSEAFIGLTSLTGLDLPSHITTIHEKAFSNCQVNGDVNIDDISVYYDSQTIKLSADAFSGSTASGALNVLGANSGRLVPSEILKSFGTLGVSSVNLGKDVNIYNLGFESFSNYTNATEMTIYTCNKPTWLINDENNGMTSYDVQRNLDLSACENLKTLNVLYGTREDIESSLTQKFLRASQLETINFGDSITKIGADTLSNDDSGRGFDSLKKIVVSTNIKAEEEADLRWKVDDVTHTEKVNVISSNAGISIDINMMKSGQYSGFEVYFKDAAKGYYYKNTKTGNVEGDFTSLEIVKDESGNFQTSYNKQKPDGNTLVHKLKIIRETDKNNATSYLSGITPAFMSIFKNANIVRELEIDYGVKSVSDNAFSIVNMFSSSVITPQNYKPGEGFTLRFLTKSNGDTGINEGSLSSSIFGTHIGRVSNIDVYGPDKDSSVVYKAFNNSDGAYASRHTYNGSDELADTNYLLTFNSNLNKDSDGFNGVLKIFSNYGSNKDKTIEENQETGILADAYLAKNGTTITMPEDKNKDTNEWVIVGWYNTAACNEDDPKLIPNAQNKVDFVVDGEQAEYAFDYVKNDNKSIRTLTLYAKWERKPYINVSLDLQEQNEITEGKASNPSLYPIGANYGTGASDTIRVKYGASFAHLILNENGEKSSKEDLPVAYQAGFKFDGWFTKENGQGTKVTQSTILNREFLMGVYSSITSETTEDEIKDGIINGDYPITLYAKYTKINFRVVYHAVPGADNQGTSAIFNAAYGGLVPSSKDVVSNDAFTYFTSFVAKDYENIGFNSGWLTFVGYTYENDTLTGDLNARVKDALDNDLLFDYTLKDESSSIWQAGVLGAKLMDALYDYEDAQTNIDLDAAIFNGVDIHLYCQYVPKTITIKYAADEYTTANAAFDAQKEVSLYLADNARTIEPELTEINILNGANYLTKIGYTYGQSNGGNIRGWSSGNNTNYNVGAKTSAAAFVENAGYKIGSQTTGTDPADGVIITLNAVFIPNELRIVYNANGGNFADGANTSQSVNYSTEFNTLSVDKVSKDGAILAGWSLVPYGPAISENVYQNFMLIDTTAPTNSVGENGYYYLNTTSSALYHKESGEWVLIDDGAKTTVSTEAPNVAPTAEDEGKYYVNTTSWLIYKAVMFNNGIVRWSKVNDINRLFSKSGAKYTLQTASSTPETLLVEANLRYPTVAEAQPNVQITLYAVWEYEEYNLDINYGDGTANGTQYVVYGQSYNDIDLTGHNKTGKIFAGFYTEDNGQGTQIYAGGGTDAAWIAKANENGFVYDLGDYTINETTKERSIIRPVLSANWVNETYTVTYEMRQYVAGAQITAQGNLRDPKNNYANVKTTFNTSLSDGEGNPLAFTWTASAEDNTQDFVFVRYMVKHKNDAGEDVLSYSSSMNLAITEDFINNYANGKNIYIYVDVRAKVYELEFAIDPNSTYGPVKQITLPDASFEDYVSEIRDGDNNLMGFKVYVVLKNNMNILVPQSYFATDGDHIIASRTTVFTGLKTNITAMPSVTLYNGIFGHYAYNEQNYTPTSIVAQPVIDAGPDLSVIDVSIVGKDYNKTNINITLVSPNENAYKTAWLAGALDGWTVSGTYAEGGNFNNSGTTAVIPNIREGANITITITVKDGFRIGATIDDASNLQTTTVVIASVPYAFSQTAYSIDIEAKVYGVKYQVSYNGGTGATGSMENSEFRVVGNDAQVTISDANERFKIATNLYSKIGYDFLGWDTNSAANNVVFGNEDYVWINRTINETYFDEITNLTTTENAVVPLYAVWGVDGQTPEIGGSHDYTINYLANTPNDTTAPENTIASVGGLDYANGQITLAANTYAVNGYTNVGKWFYDAECTNEVSAVVDMAVSAIVNAANAAGQNTESEYVVNLYTKWTKEQYSIVFDENGGTAVSDIANVSFGETLASPISATMPTTTKTGYNFVGWYVHSDFTGSHFEMTIMQDLDVYADDEKATYGNRVLTLYAKWVTKEYSIVFEENGGDAVSDIANVAFGATLANPISETTPETSKTGYEFKGWYVHSDFSGTAINWATMPDLDAYALDANATYNAQTQTLTLYAKWTIEQYNLIYEDNDAIEDILPETIAYAAVYTAPQPTKTGYTFSGWYVHSDFSGTAINWATMPDLDVYAEDGAATSYVAETKTLTLYAKWGIEYYNIAFAENGGDDVSDISNVAYGATLANAINETTPTTNKTGYTFSGWYVHSDFSGSHFEMTIMTDLDSYALDTNATYNTQNKTLTLYAKWTANVYDIIYKDQGDNTFSGSHINTPELHPTTHTYDTSTTLNGAIKTGYRFDGWYDVAACTGSARTTIGAQEFDDTNTETALIGNRQIILYAKWTVAPYTIEFDSNGGSIVSPIEAVYQGNITLPTPTKAGYGFDGWFAHSDFSDSAITWTTMPDLDAYISDANANYDLQTKTLTLYAKWTAQALNDLVDKNGNPVALTLDLNVPSLSGTTNAGFGTATNWTINGTKATNNSIVFDSAIGTLPVPSVINAGYNITFKGWNYSYYNPATESVVNVIEQSTSTIEALVYNFVGDTGLPSSITMTAQWTATVGTFNLVLHLNGTDYIKNGTTTILAETTGTSLYGGTYDSVAGTLTFEFEYEDSLSDALGLAYGKYGTTFVCWSDNNSRTQANQVGSTYNSSNIMPAGDLHLYAIYSDAYYTTDHNTTDPEQGRYQRYSIIYNANTPDDIHTGTSITIPSNQTEVWGDNNNVVIGAASLLGFTFNGYGFTKSMADSGTSLLAAGTYSMRAIASAATSAGVDVETGHIINLYASWTINQYSIVLHANNGTDATDVPGSAAYSAENYVLPSPATLFSKLGYTANTYWAYDATGTYMMNSLTSDVYDMVVAAIAAGQTPETAEIFGNVSVHALHFYVKWTANAYTINFETNGGSAVNSISTHYDANDITINATTPSTTKTGYRFDGWCENNDNVNNTGTGEVVIWDNEHPIPYLGLNNTTKTLYAKWTLETYTIDFEENGGDEVDSITASFGEDITLETPIKLGYTFEGWFDNSSLTGTAINWTTMPDLGAMGATKILYAKWSGTELDDLVDEDNEKVEFTLDLNQPELTSKQITASFGTLSDYTITGTKATTGSIVFDGVIGTINVNFYRIGYVVSAPTWKLYITGTNNEITTDNTEYDDSIKSAYTTTELQNMIYDFMSGGYVVSVTAKAQWSDPVAQKLDDLEDENNNKVKFVVDLNSDYATFIDGSNNPVSSGTLGNYSINNKTATTSEIIFGSAIGTIPSMSCSRTGYTTTHDGWKLFKLNNQAISGTIYTTAQLEALTYNFVSNGYAMSVVAKAQWTSTPNTYTITYRDQGDAAFSGTHIDTPNAHPTTHTYDTLTMLNGATKTGYRFDGWYDLPACTGSARTTIGATARTADITLYAKWTIEEYNIDFEENGGNPISPISVTYDQEVNLDDATRTGYTFRGWFDNANLTGDAIDWSDGVPDLDVYDGSANYATNTKTLTLYAKWEVKNIDDMGLTLTIVLDIETNSLSNTSYFENLENWSIDTTQTNPKTTTNAIEFDSAIGTTPVPHGQKVGYNVTLLKYRDNATNVEYTPEDFAALVWTFTSSKTFTTVWNLQARYVDVTVYHMIQQTNGSYLQDEQAGYISNQYYADSTNNAIRPLVRSNLTNWTNGFDAIYATTSLDTNAEHIDIDDSEHGFTALADGSTKIYIYYARAQYTIDFEENGDNSVSAISAYYEERITLPIPTTTGYEFDGWYAHSDFSDNRITWTAMPNLESLYKNDANANYDPVTKTLTLYAKWTIESYTINFEENGGTTVSSITKNYGEAFDTIFTTTTPATSKNGYTFGGWCETNDTSLSNESAPTGTGTPVDWSTMPDLGENGATTTLYAKWTINTYTLTYVYGNGTPDASTTFTIKDNLVAAAEPAWAGRTFGGWLVTEIAGGIVNAGNWVINKNYAAGANIFPESVEDTEGKYANATLTAQWTIKQFNIVFDENDGTAVSDILRTNYGTAIAINASQPSTSKTGYVFDGWFDNSGFIGTAITWSTMPDLDEYAEDGNATYDAQTRTLTLYAKWTIKTYSVGYNTQFVDSDGYNDSWPTELAGVSVSAIAGQNSKNYGQSLAIADAASITFTQNGGTYKIISWVLTNNKNNLSYEMTETPELIDGGTSSVSLTFANGQTWFNALGLNERNDYNVEITATAKVQLKTFTVTLNMFFGSPVDNSYSETYGLIVAPINSISVGTTLQEILDDYITNNPSVNLTYSLEFGTYNETVAFSGFDIDTENGTALNSSFIMDTSVNVYFARKSYETTIVLCNDDYVYSTYAPELKAGFTPIIYFGSAYVSQTAIPVSAAYSTGINAQGRPYVVITTLYNTGVCMKSGTYNSENAGIIYQLDRGPASAFGNGVSHIGSTAVANYSESIVTENNTRVLKWNITYTTIYYDPMDGYINQSNPDNRAGTDPVSNPAATNAGVLGTSNQYKTHSIQVPTGLPIGGKNGILPVATQDSGEDGFAGWYQSPTTDVKYRKTSSTNAILYTTPQVNDDEFGNTEASNSGIHVTFDSEKPGYSRQTKYPTNDTTLLSIAEVGIPGGRLYNANGLLKFEITHSELENHQNGDQIIIPSLTISLYIQGLDVSGSAIEIIDGGSFVFEYDNGDWVFVSPTEDENCGYVSINDINVGLAGLYSIDLEARIENYIIYKPANSSSSTKYYMGDQPIYFAITLDIPTEDSDLQTITYVDLSSTSNKIPASPSNHATGSTMYYYAAYSPMLYLHTGWTKANVGTVDYTNFENASYTNGLWLKENREVINANGRDVSAVYSCITIIKQNNEYVYAIPKALVSSVIGTFYSTMLPKPMLLTYEIAFAFTEWRTAANGGGNVIANSSTSTNAVVSYSSDVSTDWYANYQKALTIEFYDVDAVTGSTTRIDRIDINSTSNSNTIASTGQTTKFANINTNKLGRTFNGWYSTTSGGTQLTESTTVSQLQNFASYNQSTQIVAVYGNWGAYGSKDTLTVYFKELQANGNFTIPRQVVINKGDNFATAQSYLDKRINGNGAVQDYNIPSIQANPNSEDFAKLLGKNWLYTTTNYTTLSSLDNVITTLNNFNGNTGINYNIYVYPAYTTKFVIEFWANGSLVQTTTTWQGNSTNLPTGLEKAGYRYVGWTYGESDSAVSSDALITTTGTNKPSDDARSKIDYRTDYSTISSSWTPTISELVNIKNYSNNTLYATWGKTYTVKFHVWSPNTEKQHWPNYVIDSGETATGVCAGDKNFPMAAWHTFPNTSITRYVDSGYWYYTDPTNALNESVCESNDKYYSSTGLNVDFAGTYGSAGEIYLHRHVYEYVNKTLYVDADDNGSYELVYHYDGNATIDLDDVLWNARMDLSGTYVFHAFDFSGFGSFNESTKVFTWDEGNAYLTQQFYYVMTVNQGAHVSLSVSNYLNTSSYEYPGTYRIRKGQSLSVTATATNESGTLDNVITSQTTVGSVSVTYYYAFNGWYDSTNDSSYIGNTNPASFGAQYANHVITASAENTGHSGPSKTLTTSIGSNDTDGTITGYLGASGDTISFGTTYYILNSVSSLEVSVFVIGGGDYSNATQTQSSGSVDSTYYKSKYDFNGDLVTFSTIGQTNTITASAKSLQVKYRFYATNDLNNNSNLASGKITATYTYGENNGYYYNCDASSPRQLDYGFYISGYMPIDQSIDYGHMSIKGVTSDKEKVISGSCGLIDSNYSYSYALGNVTYDVPVTYSTNTDTSFVYNWKNYTTLAAAVADAGDGTIYANTSNSGSVTITNHLNVNALQSGLSLGNITISGDKNINVSGNNMSISSLIIPKTGINSQDTTLTGISSVSSLAFSGDYYSQGYEITIYTSGSLPTVSGWSKATMSGGYKYTKN